MKIVLLIGLAGVIGTLSRYFMGRTVNAVFPDYPWGTLGVNIVGAFVAGFCFVLCKSRFSQFEEYFPVLFLGFLGGVHHLQYLYCGEYSGLPVNGKSAFDMPRVHIFTR